MNGSFIGQLLGLTKGGGENRTSADVLPPRCDVDDMVEQFHEKMDDATRTFYDKQLKSKKLPAMDAFLAQDSQTGGYSFEAFVLIKDFLSAFFLTNSLNQKFCFS